MSLTLAVNDKNDLYLGADGALSRATGERAVMQAAQHAARTLQAEMVYAVDRGIPYFSIAWNGSPNVPQFEAHLRRELRAVDGVVDVTEIETQVSNNKLTYRAVIRTVYGLAVING